MEMLSRYEYKLSFKRFIPTISAKTDGCLSDFGFYYINTKSFRENIYYLFVDNQQSFLTNCFKVACLHVVPSLLFVNKAT